MVQVGDEFRGLELPPEAFDNPGDTASLEIKNSPVGLAGNVARPI